MTQRVTGQRFRQRKLSTKQTLPVLREHEVEKATADEDAQRHIPKLETGVEKNEETEHHLQAIISATQAGISTGGTISQLYIPTPETAQSQLQYSQLYPPTFRQPHSYIRFSSTVEDCTGTPYCMNEEDEAYLKAANAKKTWGKGVTCSEDDLERIVSFFEETSATKQPYASVSGDAPILTFEEMEASYDDASEPLEETSRRFAKEVYEHWKRERMKRGNRSLLPNLKFETNLETDDADPYVCFRRREIRQARKTRGRDAQVVDKLKKLRKELEDARLLMSMVRKREEHRRDQLLLDKQIFEQRAAMKEAKRNLGLTSKEDDVDLINQKPSPKPKPKLDPVSTGPRGVPGMLPRAQLARADGRPLDSDLKSLQEQRDQQEAAVQREIDQLLVRHRQWNKGYVDMTWRAITPPLEEDYGKSSFRSAVPEYKGLPTPPASVTSEPSGDKMDIDERPGSRMSRSSRSSRKDQQEEKGTVAVRYASPPPDASLRSRPSYRRRTGRGGRHWIDRRGLKRPPMENIDERVAERFKFDVDSDEEIDLYPVNPYDTAHISYRVARIFGSPDKANPAQQHQSRKSLGGPAATAAAAQAGAAHPGRQSLPASVGGSG